ncbi:MAG TPA: MFS transporter [Gaiellaceae bacterium]|nr:MFS transporter [Gaiellaceae bacterium]
MDRRGPLADSYPAAVALVVCALVPFLAVAGALAPLTKLIGTDLHLSQRALELTTAMSYAAYAVGTVISVQLAQHLRQRRMLLLYVTVFVAAAVVAAAAPTPGLWIAAFVLAGLCTSLMLIAAVPPLVIGFGADKVASTGVVMNLCIFGAVAAGPSIGSFEAARNDWRTLFWVVAGIGVAAWALSLLTFEDAEPQDPDAPWDWTALGLSVAGCVAAFYGAAQLEIEKHATALALATLLGGLALVVAMIVHQYRKRNSLMPVEQLATTFPVVGILVALAASAGAFGLMSLSLTALEHRDPAQVGLLFLPELAAAMLTAAIFGAIFRKRFTPLYAMGGLVVLCAAAAVLSGVATGGDVRIAIGAGLLGLGVGAAVSPGLFMAGFSLASAQIQRVFALIELQRGVTAFLFAPIVLYLAGALAPETAAGISDAVWICFGVCAAGLIVALVVFLAGGARLRRPDLERWQEEGKPAWESPELLSAARAFAGDRRETAGLRH